jgi:hypothetical protein
MGIHPIMGIITVGILTALLGDIVCQMFHVTWDQPGQGRNFPIENSGQVLVPLYSKCSRAMLFVDCPPPHDVQKYK